MNISALAVRIPMLNILKIELGTQNKVTFDAKKLYDYLDFTVHRLIC